MLKIFRKLTILLLIIMQPEVQCLADNAGASNEIRFNIIQDTYISNDSGMNFGNDKVLKLLDSPTAKSSAFMKVDFSSFEGNTCSAAYLCFFNQTAADTMVTIFGYSDDQWNEKTITWNNQPDSKEAAPIRFVNAGVEGWYRTDVTAFINRQMEDKAASFRFDGQAEDSTEIWIASSELNKYKPYLVITPGEAPKPGAYNIPFTKMEAEEAETNGQINYSVNQPDISYEASGRACVELDETGEFLEFTSSVTANRLTLRYNIPYDTYGTISIYVNNKLTKRLELTSYRIWLYKAAGMPGSRFTFWDEAIVELPDTVKPADKIRVVKDEEDNLDIYRIDFLELELAPEPLQKPDESWISVTDSPYNANGEDGLDDLLAIQKCINDSLSRTKKVWIPEGTFICTDQLNVPEGVEIRGAGIWHTIFNSSQPATGQNRSFLLSGKNVLKDFKLTHPYNIRGRNGGIRLASNCIIDGVWLEYSMGAGIFGYSIENTVVKNCRIRTTFADGIHFARNSKNCIMENNTLRNTGDDSLALIGYNEVGDINNICRYNTVETAVWGRGATIAGGSYNTFEMNYFEDIALGSGILVSVEEYSGTENPFCKSFLIQDNLLVRSGRKDVDTYGGSIFIDGELDVPFLGDIHHNTIRAPLRNGISAIHHVTPDIKIYGNTIELPSEKGSYIKTLSEADPTIGSNYLLETRNDKEFEFNIVVKFNGKDIAFVDQKPCFAENGIILPLRGIFEELGASVEWNEEEQSIASVREDQKIVIKVNQNTAVINGETVSLDISPQIVNGRTMISSQFVGDAFNALVRWDENNHTIWITSEEERGMKKAKASRLYFPTDDTYADMNNSNSVSGAKKDLLIYHIGSSREIQTYLKFDLSSLQDLKPSKATLKLYCFEKNDKSGDVNLKVFTTEADWTEESVKWSNKPASIQEISSAQLSENNKYVEWDITSYVRQQTNENKTINLMIKSEQDLTNIIKFHSKESVIYEPCIEIIP